MTDFKSYQKYEICFSRDSRICFSSFFYSCERNSQSMISMRKGLERRFFFVGIGEHLRTREEEADEDEAAYCRISATLPPYHLFC
jgi:hypothetical protein